MSLLPLVYATLRASSNVIDIVDDRIYRHGEAGEETVAPYVTWFVVVGVPENTLDERPRADATTVQIDCWSDNDGTGDEGVETLAKLVRDAMETDHHMTAVVVNGKDPETKRYRIGMTFTMWQHRSDPDL